MSTFPEAQAASFQEYSWQLAFDAFSGKKENDSSTLSEAIPVGSFDSM